MDRIDRNQRRNFPQGQLTGGWEADVSTAPKRFTTTRTFRLFLRFRVNKEFTPSFFDGIRQPGFDAHAEAQKGASTNSPGK